MNESGSKAWSSRVKSILSILSPRQEPLHRTERSSQARIPKNIEYKVVNHRDQAILSSISRVARYNDAKNATYKYTNLSAIN